MAQVDFIYDGEGFYVTAIEDSIGASDAVVEAHVFVESFEAVSSGLITDFISFDTITNIQDDPGYTLLKLPSEVIKGLADTKAMTTDDELNLLCLSREFLWKISPTGEVLSKQFLKPTFKNYNSDTIKYAKVYQNNLYVLHYDVIAADRYVIIKDFIGMKEELHTLKNSAVPHTQQDTYLSWELANPPAQFSYELVPAVGVFKFSKYDITNGEELSSIYINITVLGQVNASNGYLSAPVSFDILNGKLFILDNGDATVKVYDMESGIFLGKLIDSDLLFAPSAFFLDSSDYAWVVDKPRVTNMGVTDQIKKINLSSYNIDETYDFTQKPIFAFSKSANYSDKIMLLRDGQKYGYYYDFIRDTTIDLILNGHAVQSIHIANSTEMYVWNNNPFDIRRINLNTKEVTNIRDCYEPISIAKEFVVDNETILLSDTGLKEVGIYHLHGERSGTLIDHVHPKGIARIGDDYYITDIEESVILKYSNSILTRLHNYDLIRPTDITTDGNLLYVTDCGKNAVIIMNTEGITQKIIGTSGKLDGQFTYPVTTLLSGSELFVLDSGNFRIQVFTLNGEFLRKYILSDAIPPETTRKNTSSLITSDIDDSSETVAGKESIWGDITIDSNKQFAAFRFQINVPNNAQINSAIFKIKKTYGASSQLWISMEDIYNSPPLSETSSGIYDLLYRQKTSLLSWVLPYSTGTISSPNLAAQLQTLVSKPNWSYGNAVTIILQYDYRVTQSTFIKAVSSSLDITYDIVKPIRSQGLYNHMVVDDTSIYVADIAMDAITVMDKSDEDITDSYKFVGTVMEKLSDDIFISDRDCNISYLQKFKFITDAFYNLEFDTDAAIVSFNFEPNWVTEFTEDFSHEMQTDFVEDYEWLSIIGDWVEVTMPYEYPTPTEFNLLVPDITWRDA